ncbi:DNA recombination protein RmuC [Cellvibrio fibrivorans]|uniref:DNA recombination protein RmuC n=1 Tax=Cellvibrio fibrivorans TaxID=126350 RepID=A0ABU1UV30_9GAMM|nr:DNA recombination protein RmuC [Cellvibrio fibrivorans]MDR7089051.1 DNA recombination protein RmuC [Cellvibrio fibrivorans]
MNPSVLTLIAALAGLAIGALIVYWIVGRRLDQAVFAKTHELESALQQLQHSHALREAALQQEGNQLKLQVADIKTQLQSTLQHANELQQSLGVSQQDAAGLREKTRHFDELQQQSLRKDEQLTHLAKENTELKTRLEQERKNFAEQLALLQNAKVELAKEFENLANKIFENKQQQFNLNSKSLLDNTLDPLKLQLTEFRKKVEDVYEKENAERNRLSGQVVELQKQAQKIGEDAVNLAQALKGNSKAQGNWGEVVLERLLEESGLQKGREYDTQVNFTGSDGSRLMPDVIIHLPENKDIVIDAKCSLVDYEKFCSSDDEAERKYYLNAHVNSLRSHIKSLSIKDYEKLDGIKALDFVFIFIPIEAAFMFALQHEPGLYREAYDRHIILVSPTTLLATLRTVENIWRYEKQNKNAERIAKEAGALHDQFVLLLESLDAIGNSLNKTQEAYSKARDRLQTGRGNLVKRVDDIRRLGAKTKKSIAGHLLENAGAEIETEELLLDMDQPDDAGGR